MIMNFLKILLQLKSGGKKFDEKKKDKKAFKILEEYRK